MAFSIEEFKSNALRYGVVRPSQFMAVIPAAPPCVSRDTRFLAYLCQASALPGTQILTVEERRKGYAKATKIPYDTVHTDLTMTFFSDGAGSVIAFFEEWLRNIVSYGRNNINNKGALQGEMHYPSWYETEIELCTYNDASENAIVIYKMHRAYPISISEQQVTWDGGDQIQTIQVTFAFADYEIQVNKAPSYNGAPKNPNAPLGAGVVSNPGYAEQIQRGGTYDSRLSKSQQAESIITGFLGLDKLTAVLGAISNISSSINDSLNVVNNVTADVNSVINSYAGLAGVKAPNIPSIPNIQFP